MYTKIKTSLFVILLIAALFIATIPEVFAMGSSGGNYGGGNYGGGNHGNGGGRRHHSAPEPSTLLLIGTGLVGLWAFRKKLK